MGKRVNGEKEDSMNTLFPLSISPFRLSPNLQSGYARNRSHHPHLGVIYP
jgi:hypothetical protein